MKWHKKAILWRTIYLIAVIVATFLIISWLNKRYDLVCVVKNMLDAFGGCKR